MPIIMRIETSVKRFHIAIKESAAIMKQIRPSVFQRIRRRGRSLWKEIVSESLLEGIRLNLFGGSQREVISYLKSR